MELENALWDFALALYARPGVEAACLRLQDAGLSINRLLYCCWLGQQGRQLPVGALRQGRAEQWQAEITRPLRTLRYKVRRRKATAPDLDACYRALRQAELAAEQVELALLYRAAASCPAVTAGAGLILQNLNCYLADAGQVPDHAMLSALEPLLAACCTLPANWQHWLQQPGK